MSKRQTLEQVDAALKRWNPRLTRAANMVGKLQRQRTRLANKSASASPAAAVEDRAPRVSVVAAPQAPMPVAAAAVSDVTDIPVTELPIADSLEIPGFLRRAGSIGGMTPADLAVAKAIEDGNADRKRRKAAGRAATRKAKARGELRAMPLSGKAALERIAHG